MVRVPKVPSIHQRTGKRPATLSGGWGCFDVLKSNGYHLEHNFGHGQQNLAMMFAAMNMLAFAIHTVRDCLERMWVEARIAERARERFYEHIRTITACLVFPDWNTLLQTLIDSKPPPESQAQKAR